MAMEPNFAVLLQKGHHLSATLTENSAPLSQLDRILAFLGVRPDEKKVTILLFSNMFMAGLAIGLVRVCAYTLFLERFGAEQLAIIAVMLAVAGTVITLALSSLARSSLRGELFLILGTVFVGLVIARGMLGVSESDWLIFSLPLFFELIYMLFSLQFICFMSSLLNVRQTKRLTGLARSGEFLAELVGGLSVAGLLLFLNVEDLLIVGAVATLAVFGIVQLTIVSFKEKLVYTTEDAAEGAERAEGRVAGLIRSPYVRLISLCYATFIFAYFFLDVAFYSYAETIYSNEVDLAAFLGRFFSISGLLTLIVMVFLYSTFFRKAGILGGLLIFPITVMAGSLAVSLLEFSDATISVIFIAMVATNGARIILQSAIWKPSVAILFQVLPNRQRARGTSLIEGVVDPLSGGLAGIALYVLSDYLGWQPEQFLLVLAGLMFVWILIGFAIHRMYLANLVLSLQKRKLGELSLKDLDNRSLQIIKDGLSSPYPAEVFYCLNILEQIEHPEITELLKVVISHDDRDVRMDVMRRVAELDIHPLTRHVNERIDDEEDPDVLGQALQTYASLLPEDTFERLDPFLKDEREAVSKGALTGILRWESNNDKAQNYLLSLIRSGNPANRIFAAEVIGNIGQANYSGYLVELLDDPEVAIEEKAIQAAGRIKDHRLINVLVSKLGKPSVQGTSSFALRFYGEEALYELDIGFSSPLFGRTERLHIVDVIREIGGLQAMEILLNHMNTPEPEVQHQIYSSLASLHFQADADDKYVFVNKLNEEVQLITWLLAAMEDLYGHEQYELVHRALGNEMDMHRDNMLLLISYLFPSIMMLDTRANIDSKVAELRIFALEVLDNILSAEIKQIVLPLLDDFTVAERLEAMAVRFPQKRLDPEARIHDILDKHFAKASYWSRSCLLYHMGEAAVPEYLPSLQASLQDKEPVIRETALWALSKLDPEDLDRTLYSFQSDPSPLVSDVVNNLIKERAEA